MPKRGAALLRAAAVHRPGQVDHHVGHRRRRHDRLVASGGQLDGAPRPGQPRRQPIEHRIRWHIGEIGGADSHPGAGAVAFAVDLHRSRGLGVAPPQPVRGREERRLDLVAGEPVQLIGAAEPPRARLPATSEGTPAPRCPGPGRPNRRARRRPAAAARCRGLRGAERAASCEAATRPAMADGSTSLDRTDPTCASSPWRTIEMTVVLRLVDSPLVVIELPAHRSDASARSVTNTIVSSALPSRRASASARSTTCCAPITVYRPASSRVLSTFTPRNSADGHPWLTAATWPGCALPQLNAPPSRHVDGPPTASIEPQKSVVVAW